MTPDAIVKTLETPYSYVLLGSLLITLGISMVIAFRDLKTMQVPMKISIIMPAVYTVLYIVLILINGTGVKVQLISGVSIAPLHGLIAGSVLAAGTMSIVYLTKKKGVGFGDVPFLALSGLVGGYEKTIIGLYIAVFAALVYGLAKGLKQKKWRGMRIPFIPFIALGITVSMLLGDDALTSILSSLTRLV